jgi:lysophospholipase L1-like esterase
LNFAVGNTNYSAGTHQFVTNASSVNIAGSGDKIADQTTEWNNLVGKTTLDAVIMQIGLNDINTFVGNGTKTSTQIIADLQTFVDLVATDAPQAKIIMSALTPCREWLESGSVSPDLENLYPAWQAVNEAIMGEGANAITNANIAARVDAHNTTLDDGSGNLDEFYNHDEAAPVHPSNEGRWYIGQSWEAGIETAFTDTPTPSTRSVSGTMELTRRNFGAQRTRSGLR